MEQRMNGPDAVCWTSDGRQVTVPRASLVIRPAAYVFAFGFENRILIVMPWECQRHIAIPGGGQEQGETLPETVVRETKEESGLDVRIAGYLGYEEGNFFWEPGNTAWQVIGHFYVGWIDEPRLPFAPDATSVKEGLPFWVEPESMRDRFGYPLYRRAAERWLFAPETRIVRPTKP
jgi:8-oxo-dGTP pyrophosphatase MutT (NUDIX family)